MDITVWDRNGNVVWHVDGTWLNAVFIALLFIGIVLTFAWPRKAQPK